MVAGGGKQSSGPAAVVGSSSAIQPQLLEAVQQQLLEAVVYALLTMLDTQAALRYTGITRRSGVRPVTPRPPGAFSTAYGASLLSRFRLVKLLDRQTIGKVSNGACNR